MVRELSELLADSVDARARSVAGLTPAADDVAAVVRTVRRRRVVRHTLQSLAVVPIVAGLAAGAYVGIGALQSQPTPPAATPDVVAPPGELEKGNLRSDPGIPPHHEAPADLRAHVGEGWTALTYRPVAGSDTDGIAAEPTEHALFLVAPDGAIFRTAWLQADLEISLVHWDAASERARVTWSGTGDRPLTLGWLDVFSGELTQDAEQFSQWARFVDVTSDGSEIWVEDPAYVDGEYTGGVTVWSVTPDGIHREVADIGALHAGAIDPSGARMLAAPQTDEGFAVVDLGSGDVREVPFGMSGQSCAVVGWLDATDVAALCHDPVSDEAAAAMDRVDFVAQGAGLYRVEAAAGGGAELLHTFADGEPVPEAWTGTVTGDGSFAFIASSGFPGGCSLGVGAWDGSQPRAILGPGEHGANMFFLEPGGPGTVLVTASQSCESSGVQGEVTSVDVATGTARVLTPWLEAFPEDGIDYWHLTVTSAAAAR